MFSLVITVYNDKILSSVYEDGKMVEQTEIYRLPLKKKDEKNS